MKGFSFEVPIKHLDDFSDLQDYIFALSFLFKDKDYEDYISRQKEDGKIIVLDNSYNELKVPTKVVELVNLFNEINADYVIAPDCDTWTIDNYTLIWNEITLYLPFEKIFMVARCPRHFSFFEELGVKNIAIPYEFRPAYTGIPPAGEKYHFPEDIALRGAHFLGLNTAWEPLYSQAKSCDTSMPIKVALKGMTIEDWIYSGCKHIDTEIDFFARKMKPIEVHLARENITFLKGMNLNHFKNI